MWKFIVHLALASPKFLTHLPEFLVMDWSSESISHLEKHLTVYFKVFQVIWAIHFIGWSNRSRPTCLRKKYAQKNTLSVLCCDIQPDQEELRLDSCFDEPSSDERLAWCKCQGLHCSLMYILVASLSTCNLFNVQNFDLKPDMHYSNINLRSNASSLVHSDVFIAKLEDKECAFHLAHIESYKTGGRHSLHLQQIFHEYTVCDHSENTQFPSRYYISGGRKPVLAMKASRIIDGQVFAAEKPLSQGEVGFDPSMAHDLPWGEGLHPSDNRSPDDTSTAQNQVNVRPLPYLWIAGWIMWFDPSLTPCLEGTISSSKSAPHLNQLQDVNVRSGWSWSHKALSPLVSLS